MLWVALATDYDGTLAHDGRVLGSTLEALERFKASGRKLILVTGRQAPDLKRAFDGLDLFDLVVAENGAVLYRPAAAEERALSPPPPAGFVEALRARGVEPLSVGRSIVATWEPNEGKVLEVIHALGLEWQIIFNKGAVMCLPPGVNKASGLAAALEAVELALPNVVGVGDAENDHAFMTACGCSAAVANALPALKAEVDLVLDGDHGSGVEELVERVMRAGVDRPLASIPRQELVLGEKADGQPSRFSPDEGALLIAGASGVGKSTLAKALIERIDALGHQALIVDPEGEHGVLGRAAALGDPSAPPSLDEAMTILKRPGQGVVLNLLGQDVTDRPRFFAALMGRIGELRAATGRPHWIVLDEAHHLLPAEGQVGASPLPAELPGVILITTDPAALSPPALEAVRAVAAVGPEAPRVIEQVAGAPVEGEAPGDRWFLFWRRGEGSAARVQAPRPEGEHQRHVRKYAEGELGEDKSFFFRGPEGRLNLRAQNLMLFLQIGEGVDDRTWLHHLRRRDYSRWFREALDDEDMAKDAARIEAEAADDPVASRRAIRELVSRRYTAAGA